MTENKIAILESRIERLEAEKAENIELLKNIRDYLKQGKHCNLVSAIYSEDINKFLKKHRVEI